MQIQEGRRIKALLCQIKPIRKQKTKNIKRCEESLKMYSSKDKLDVILFPEMTFTGYNFKDQEDAMPLSIKKDEGQQFIFARKIAHLTESYIVFGYIEKQQFEGKITLYNSAAVLDRTGKLIYNYRKKHLFFNDKLWAKEGQNFISFDLINTKKEPITCALGICMDINPKDFTSGEFELADFILKSKSEVLLFLTNWVDSQKLQIQKSDVIATYNYWLHRLNPILKMKSTFLFLAADRSGQQFDVFSKKMISFYGSSCAIMLNPAKLISNLDVQNEMYLVVETFLPLK